MKKSKFVAIALAAALALSPVAASAITGGAAAGKTFGIGHPGFWVGNIAITAVSLIACAAIVGHQSHRELNTKEVFLGFPSPLGMFVCPTLT